MEALPRGRAEIGVGSRAGRANTPSPPKRPARRRARLSSRLTSSLRTGSKRLMASFSKGGAVGGAVDKNALQIVDDGYSAQAEQREDAESLFSHSPLGDNATSAATALSESRHSASSRTLALEVGLSAHEYLEDCFEVSALDREKFDAVPEISTSDFTVLRHLGKGNFNDVFEVSCDGGRLLDNEVGNAVPSRGTRASLSGSVTTAKPGGHKPVLALKCLRPQLRSNADQFTIGAEDLVHETAVLANLNHRHIIKLHGRASGHLTNAFALNDGYFILLDKLEETLYSRMKEWKQSQECALRGPAAKQLEVACSISDAMCHLHSKNIIFRDLKPANVGFDLTGVLKLFDFGFATGLPERDENNPSGFLYDRCGTPRYMAPEVGLSLGYGLPADVYSFGILLWEICAMAKPFASIRTSNDFDTHVFMGGKRPTVEDRWPSAVREIMSGCWSAAPSKRPTMLEVESALFSMISSDKCERQARLKALRSSITRRRSNSRR